RAGMSPSTRFDEARRGSRPVLQFLLLIGLLCGARSSAAQVDEIVAGASGNVVLRGPWVTSPWRKPLPRLAVFALGSFTYERFVDHSGWSWSDFNQRLARGPALGAAAPHPHAPRHATPLAPAAALAARATPAATAVGSEFLGGRRRARLAPRDRERHVAARAASRVIPALGELGAMAAPGAHHVRLARIRGVHHGPVGGRSVAQLHERAGDGHRAPPHRQLHLLGGAAHDRVPRPGP